MDSTPIASARMAEARDRHPPAAVNFHRDVHCLLGLPFDAVRMADVIGLVRDAAARRTACFISTPNLNFLIACRSDTPFRESVINSDLSIADGMPLVWTARLLGIPILERVTGSGLFELLRTGPSKRLSVYLYGGPDGVAGTACGRLNAEPGGVHCAGFASPGFGSVKDMSSDATIAAINASDADFLLVSLGAKKGQAWIEHNRARISVPVISHLGAVMNFVAGTFRRAPPWMQRTGLEWLWRIKEEPALWRRYCSDGLAFIRLLATRVIPHYWFLHRHAPTRREIDSAALEICQGIDETVIRLRGAWTRENLGPLRECFSSVSPADNDVRIDMEQVSFVDASLLGLLLLLHGSQKSHARRLTCAPLSRQVRRLFEYGCCEFLLDARLPVATEVSASAPDMTREHKTAFSWCPSRSLLASIRAYQRCAVSRNPLVALIARPIAVLRHRFWSVVTGADIPLNTQIGGGLLMPHPNGVVIHPDVRIGPNCLIFQQVTIGSGRGGVPRVGGHVDIGAGAKILGAVEIGDHARIGANAVVLREVPAGKSAVGVPAVVVDG